MACQLEEFCLEVEQQPQPIFPSISKLRINILKPTV